MPTPSSHWPSGETSGETAWTPGHTRARRNHRLCRQSPDDGGGSSLAIASTRPPPPPSPAHAWACGLFNHTLSRLTAFVMSGSSLIDKRVGAVRETWGGVLRPGRLLVFSDGDGVNQTAIALAGTSSTHEGSQKKWPLAFEHYCKAAHLADVRSTTDWLLVADDDTYIFVPNLVALLALGFSPDWPYVLGRPWRTENVTLPNGGPGYVLSRAAMVRVCGHVDEFLAHHWKSYWSDVNMGSFLGSLNVTFVPLDGLYLRNLTAGTMGVRRLAPSLEEGVLVPELPTGAPLSNHWVFPDEMRQLHKEDGMAAIMASCGNPANAFGPSPLPASSIPHFIERFKAAERRGGVTATTTTTTTTTPAAGAFKHALVDALASMDADVTAQVQPVTRWVGNRSFLMHPITFGIPAQYVRGVVPAKSQALATVIPGDHTTYKYWPRPGAPPAELADLERAYYADMERSLFGLTWKKAGWDCLRHLELLASGCVPLFTDIQDAPAGMLTLYPKKVLGLLLRFPGLVALEGVPGQRPVDAQRVADAPPVPRNVTIDMAALDKRLYSLTVAALLDFTRRRLTTAGVAAHLLSVMGVDAPHCGLGLGEATHASHRRRRTALAWRRHWLRLAVDPIDAAASPPPPPPCRPLRVLFLAMAKDTNDYMTDMLVHGLVDLLGPAQVTQHHRRDVLYTTPDLLFEDRRAPARAAQYGMGFTYGNTLYDSLDTADEVADAANPDTLARLRSDIAAQSFDIVILGLIHRGRPPLMDEVCASYPRSRVAAVHGHDYPPGDDDLIQYGACAGYFFAREAV